MEKKSDDGMAFQLQQRLFAPQPACVARELATGTQDAVARHDDTHRIAPHRCAHGSNGLRVVQARGQLAVALVSACLNGQQRFPNGLLKGCAARQIQWQIEHGPAPGKVVLKLRRGGLQQRVVWRGLPALDDLSLWSMALSLKPNATQALVAAGEGEFAQRAVGAGGVCGGYGDASFCFGGGKARWEGGLEDQLGLFVIRGVKIVSQACVGFHHDIVILRYVTCKVTRWPLENAIDRLGPIKKLGVNSTCYWPIGPR